jgi:hypothetical protein
MTLVERDAMCVPLRSLLDRGVVVVLDWQVGRAGSRAAVHDDVVARRQALFNSKKSERWLD